MEITDFPQNAIAAVWLCGCNKNKTNPNEIKINDSNFVDKDLSNGTMLSALFE